MNFEIMLSAINQTQQEKYCIIPLYEVSRSDKFTETEKIRCYQEVTKGGVGELPLNGYRVSVWGYDNVLETVVMVLYHWKCN